MSELTSDPQAASEPEVRSSALLERVVSDVVARYGKEPRREWKTWDVWSGRMVLNTETSEAYLSRLIREAFERSPCYDGKASRK